MKTDLTKLDPTYYKAKTIPSVVEFEKLAYLSITGTGDPSGSEFAKNIEALYTVAYTLKFIYKEKNQDYTVPKLEGLWWFDHDKYHDISLETAPLKIPRSEWHYRLLLRLPDFVVKGSILTVVQKAHDKKKYDRILAVNFFELKEGKCVQVLHNGPFSKEPETLAKMQDFMKENNLAMNGLHHEIYLSDFRKTPEEKLKTILREPVKVLAIPE